MKRTWMIPGMLAAGLLSVSAVTYAASAQDNGGRGGSGYSRDDAPGDYGRNGGRWNNDDRSDEDRAPRWRRGDRGYDNDRGYDDDRGYDNDRGYSNDRDYGNDRGPRWRNDDRRDYGHREGRRFGNRDDSCGSRRSGWHRGEREGWHHGRGYGRHGGYHHRHEGYGPREGRRFERDDNRSSSRPGSDQTRPQPGGPRRLGQAFDPARLEGVKKEVGITPAQEQAWTKYTATLKEVSDARRARRDNMDVGALRRMSAEEHRKFRDTTISQVRKEQDSIFAAVDALIITLDEKQVAIAREMLPGYAFGGWMHNAGVQQGSGDNR